jgi:hypothetical protein
LAKESGGWGLCRNQGQQPASVFCSTTDPDYQILLAMSLAGKKQLEQIGRFDMRTFSPRPDWLREMVRYGILKPAAAAAGGGALDVYAIERRYWESLWFHQP